MGIIKAVCTSPQKGTQKKNIGRAELIENYGLKGDAHAGGGHRQVSLLADEKIQEFKSRGAEAAAGAFGENLIVAGIDLRECPVGTRFCCNRVILEVTQIGKECHQGCEIYHKVGDCIMPREGVFTQVIRGGEIAAGDWIQVQEHSEC